MKKPNHHNLSVTICIPTCFGGPALVKAARSIRKAFGEETPFIIMSDTKPLSINVKNQLKKRKITVIENKKPGSQIIKIRKMLAMVKTTYVIFTQDDITISENTATELGNFLKKHKNLSMFTIKNEPTKPTTAVDYALTAGTKLAYYIENNWNDGQNYLRGCGRFLGFKTAHMREFRIPDGIVNVDAYFYFENKRLKGKFERTEKARMYYVLPNNMPEQIRKSSRYLYCYEEMEKHFDSIAQEFAIPTSIKLQALVSVCLKSPIQFAAYVPLLITTRLVREKKKETKSAMWKVDISTK